MDFSTGGFEAYLGETKPMASDNIMVSVAYLSTTAVESRVVSAFFRVAHVRK